REAGIGIDRLVAIVEQGEQGVEHDRLRARCDDHLPRIYADPAPLFQVERERLAELDHTRRRRVMGLAALQGRYTGRDDRRRRVEVGFADLDTPPAIVAAG